MIVGQEYRDTCLGENLSGDASRGFRSEAGVVADDHSTFRILMLQYIGSDSTDNAAYILESKIIGDDRAPTVGTEFDGTVVRHWSLSLVEALDLVLAKDQRLLTLVYAASSHPNASRFCPHPATAHA